MGRRHEYQLSSEEERLHDARSASAEVRRSSAAAYQEALKERIAQETESQAQDTQRRWDRDGEPMWLKVKRALSKGPRRG